jgi:hypothetical protein
MDDQKKHPRRLGPAILHADLGPATKPVQVPQYARRPIAGFPEIRAPTAKVWSDLPTPNRQLVFVGQNAASFARDEIFMEFSIGEKRKKQIALDNVAKIGASASERPRILTDHIGRQLFYRIIQTQIMRHHEWIEQHITHATTSTSVGLQAWRIIT